LRNITSKTGLVLTNVLFVDLDIKALKRITYDLVQDMPAQRERSHVSTGEVSRFNGGGLTPERETYTEITTQIPTETTTEEQEEGDPSPPPNPKTEQSLSAFSEAATGWEEMKRCSLNSFDRENLAGASERYGDELLLAAIKETNRQGVNSWSYVEAILENWAQEKIPRVVRYTDPDTGKIKVKEVGHPTEKPSPTSWYNSFTGQVEHL